MKKPNPSYPGWSRLNYDIKTKVTCKKIDIELIPFKQYIGWFTIYKIHLSIKDNLALFCITSSFAWHSLGLSGEIYKMSMETSGTRKPREPGKNLNLGNPKEPGEPV